MSFKAGIYFLLGFFLLFLILPIILWPRAWLLAIKGFVTLFTSRNLGVCLRAKLQDTFLHGCHFEYWRIKIAYSPTLYCLFFCSAC